MLDSTSNYTIFNCPACDFTSADLAVVHDHCIDECTDAETFSAMLAHHENKPTIHTNKPTRVSRKVKTALRNASGFRPPANASSASSFSLLEAYRPTLIHAATIRDADGGSNQLVMREALDFITSLSIEDQTQVSVTTVQNYDDLGWPFES